ncbi:MAG: colanic acid biosynthesis glycosyltransferase WcaL [Microcoleus sp. CSU_2_2]|nr:colanic acid biosynthesis glycosyltransferase WcaL [Microcoleus sp. SU_5_3]NJS11063.1 colanic acid biosynthesis glycosyltransferase WcaL [Microcoleus sp. CSU_2_2]
MSDNHKTVGYLLKTYPKLSETFILNEILELERQGVSLHLFSLRKPTDEKNHPDVDKVKASVTYIPTLLPNFNFEDLISLLKSHWQLLSQSPGKYWQALQFHLQRPEKKRWNEFLQAGYLAATMQKLGLSHLQAHFANVPTATTEIAKIFGDFSYNIFAHAKDIYLTEAEILDRRIRSAEFVLTCTGFNHRHLQSVSQSNTPIYLSYHGIDLTRFTSAFAKQETEFPLMLSVGRYCEKKGFPYLIEACRQLKQQGHKFQCDLVGYGPLQAELEQLIADLDVADVVSLAGKMTQDELVKVYERASIFVLPCQVMENGDRDGIPNVLLEAMAMEIPVVSTDISGIGELVESGENGFLVPEKNPPALAEALEKLLTQPELRAQFGKAGRQRVLQQFSLERNVIEIRKLFDKMLNLNAISSQEKTITITQKIEVKV